MRGCIQLINEKRMIFFYYFFTLHRPVQGKEAFKNQGTFDFYLDLRAYRPPRKRDPLAPGRRSAWSRVRDT